MSQTPEGRVKDRVRALLKHYGAWWHMSVQTGYGAPTLDITVCHVGRFALVETKAPGGKLTPRQELTKRDAEAAGAVVFVVGRKQIGEGRDKYHYSGEAELEAWLQGLQS